jgi:Phosphotransferase enzyme family
MAGHRRPLARGTAVSTDILALATRLCRSAGLASPDAVTPLTGGKNNRVYQVASTGEAPLVLKRYHHDIQDSRDRLGAEWAFLGYAAARGIDIVPRPIARDTAAHAGLYSFCPGLRVAAVGAGHVAAALHFVEQLNATPRDVASFGPGSEACFSLVAHLATVERRVARLAAIDPAAPHASEANAYLQKDLRPAWNAIRERIADVARRDRIDIDRDIATAAQCVSPSDFGFHNALADGTGRLMFIDFEYAGRDDPAKLVCDFICQPEVPVPLSHYVTFADGVIAVLGLDASHRARCDILLDAYRIKWMCIMLNDFLPLGEARRRFAEQGERLARCRLQLDKAKASLATLSF